MRTGSLGFDVETVNLHIEVFKGGQALDPLDAWKGIQAPQGYKAKTAEVNKPTSPVAEGLAKEEGASRGRVFIHLPEHLFYEAKMEKIDMLDKYYAGIGLIGSNKGIRPNISDI